MSSAFEQLKQDLLPEVGKVVATVVYAPDKRVLVIKRPEDEEWEPGKYSPPVGHVEEGDTRFLLFLREHGVLDSNKENLYVVAGQRELAEEVKRTPSQVSLRYIGQYHDTITGLDVVVLDGMMSNSLDTPSVYPSKEASESEWFTHEHVRRLAKQGRLVGIRTYEMSFDNPYTKKIVDGYSHLTKRSK